MNSVKCYGRFLPASALENDREEEKKFLKSELILTKIYGERVSNLKIYKDIFKRRIKKLTDGVNNLFIVLNNEKNDGTKLTVGDGNTSYGILFYLMNDLVHRNRCNCNLLITFSHFEIVRNRVHDKLKRYVFPQRNVIDLGSCFGFEKEDHGWVRSKGKAHRNASLSSGYSLKAERDEYKEKKERLHGEVSEKRDTRDPCRMYTEWAKNRLVNSDVLCDVDSFLKGRKREKYRRKHTKGRSTGEWDPGAVRKVYLSGENIRDICKMLCRSGRGKSVEGFRDEVTYEVVEFYVEMAQGRGLDVSGVRSYSEVGNRSSICSKSPVSTCSVTIIVVNSLKVEDSSERAFLSQFCELFLKRREDANCPRYAHLTCEKKHSLIIKYLFSLYKLHPLGGSTTGVNSLPFELNIIYISSNFKKYRKASEFIYAYLKGLNRSEYFVQPNKKMEYLKSGFHKVDENIYVVKSLLNYYTKLEIQTGEINKRVSSLRNYLTILESSAILGAKGRHHQAWIENGINNVLNLCRSSTSESGEPIQLEKENLFFFNKEGKTIRRNYKEAARGEQHGGKYADRGTCQRSTQMKDNTKGEMNHLTRSVQRVKEIRRGINNPDKIHFKLGLYKRGGTNMIGSRDHSSIDNAYSRGNSNLEKFNQHCYKDVRETRKNVLHNCCEKKEETFVVDPNSCRNCTPVKYESSESHTHCKNDNSLKCRVKLFLPSDEDLRHFPQMDGTNHGPFARRSTPMLNFVPANGMNPKRKHSSCIDPFSNTMEVENLCDRAIVIDKEKEMKFLPCDILGMAYSNGSDSSCEENDNQLESVLHNIEQNRDFLKSISSLNSDIKKGKKKIDSRAKSLFEQVDQCLGEKPSDAGGRAGLEKLEKRHDLNATIERVRKNREPRTDGQAGKQKKKKDYTCVEMKVKRASRKLALEKCTMSNIRSGKNNLSCSGKRGKSGTFPAHGLSSNHMFDRATTGTNKLPDKGKEEEARNCVEHPVHLNGCKMDENSVEGICSPTKRKDSNLALCVNELDPLHSNNHWLGHNGGSIGKEMNMEENTQRMEEYMLSKERVNYNDNHNFMCLEESQNGDPSSIAETGALTHVSYGKGDGRGNNKIKKMQEEEESHVRSSNESIFSFSSKNKNETSKDNHYCSSEATDDDLMSSCTLGEETIRAVSPNGKKKYGINNSNGMARMRKKRQNCSAHSADNENVTAASSGSQSTGEGSNVSDSCEEEQDQSIKNYHNHFKKLLKSHMSLLQKKCVEDNNDLDLLQKIKFAKGVLREYNNVLGRSWDDKNEQSVLLRQVISNGWGVGDIMLKQHCGRSRCDRHSECVDMCKNGKDGFLTKKNRKTDSEVRSGSDAESADGGISLTGAQMSLPDFYQGVGEEACANGVEHTERCNVDRSTFPQRNGKSSDHDKKPFARGTSKESNYYNNDYVDNFDEAEIEKGYTPEGEYVQWEEPQLCVSTNKEKNISCENDKNVNASSHYYEENVLPDDPPHKGNIMTCDPNDIYNEYEEEQFGEQEKSALHVDHLDELQNGRSGASQGNYLSKSCDWENPTLRNGDTEEERNIGCGATDTIGHVVDDDIHKSDMVGNLHTGELFEPKSFTSKLDEVEDVVVQDSFTNVSKTSPDCTGEKTTLHSHAVIRKIRRKKKVLKRGIQGETNKLSRVSLKKKKLMSFILRAIERGEKDEELIAIVKSAIFKMEYFEQKKISKLKRMENEFEKLTHLEEKIVSNCLMGKSQFSGEKIQGGELHNRTVRRKNGHEGEDDNKVYQKCGSHLEEKKNKDAHSDEVKGKDKNVETYFQKKSQKDDQIGGVHPLRGGEKKEKKNNCAHVDAFQKDRVCNNFFKLNGHNRESKKSIAFSDLCVNLKNEKHSASTVDGEQAMRVVPSLSAAKLSDEALTEKSSSERTATGGDLHPIEENNTPREHHKQAGSGTGGDKCRIRITPAEETCDAFFQNCGDTANGWTKPSDHRLDGDQQHIGHSPASNDNSVRGEYPQQDRDSSKETNKNKDRNITVRYRDRGEVRRSTPHSSHTFKQKVKGKRKTNLGLSYDRSLEGQNRVPLKRNPAKECINATAGHVTLNSSFFSNGGSSKKEAISPSTESGDKSTRRVKVGVRIPVTGESIPTRERHRRRKKISDKVGKKKSTNIHTEEGKKENKGGKEHSAWEVSLGHARSEERQNSNQIDKPPLLGNSKNFHVSVRMDPPPGNNLQRKGSFRRGNASRAVFPLQNAPSNYTPFAYTQREDGYPELIPQSSNLHGQRVVSPNWDETKRTGGNPIPRCQAKDKAKGCEEGEEEQSKWNRDQRSFINVMHKSTPEMKGAKNMEQISIKTVINRQREKTIPCINYDTDRYCFKLGWWNWGKRSKLLENIERCKENIKEKYYQNRRECKHRSCTNWRSKYFTKFQPNEYLYIPVTNKNYFRSKNSLKIRSNPVSDFHKLNLKPITGFLQSYEKEKERQRKVPRGVIRVSTIPYVVDDYNVKSGVPKIGGKFGVSLGEAKIILSEDEESNLNDTSGFFAKVSKKSAPSGYFPNGRGSYSSGTNSNDEKSSKGIIFKCRTKQAHKTDFRNSSSGTAYGKRNYKARSYNIGHDINEGRTHDCRDGKAQSGHEGSNEKEGLGQRWDPKKKTTVKVRRYRIRSIESLSSVHSAPGRSPQGCSSSMVRVSSGRSTASSSVESSEVVGTTNAKCRVNLKSKKRADYPQGGKPRHIPPSQCSNKSEVRNSSRGSGSSCYSISSVGTPNEVFKKDTQRDPHFCAGHRKKLTHEENDMEKNLARRNYKQMNISSKRDYAGYTTDHDTHLNMYREDYTSMESELGRNRHGIECDGSGERDSSAGSIEKDLGEGPCRRQYCPDEINQVNCIQPDSYKRGKIQNKKKQSCKTSHHNSYAPTNDGYYHEGQHRGSANPQTRGRKGQDADFLEKQYDEYFYDN
ncbi:hypothetical protein AK88_00146 [Plasmodium fragile]|uniref:Uncharacterized protein n=1 Tax=Plasmodium fragile TaxID=5857 RepID=A0A0D9QTJ9_PLAFR|nr:uncharacterized protein AK88_00146 [Plasmodium fragile]KJP90298.1 hypothetical protein AK88_00146 [Plasmodium fragile]